MLNKDCRENFKVEEEVEIDHQLIILILVLLVYTSINTLKKWKQY